MKKDQLSGKLDDFYSRLLEMADAPSPAHGDDGQPKVGFVDKLKAFEAGVRWMMVKYKVDEEQDPDDFAKARSNLTSRSRRGGAAQPKPNGAS